LRIGLPLAEARRRIRLVLRRNEVHIAIIFFAGEIRYGSSGTDTAEGNAHNTESKQTAQGASKKPFSEGIQYDKEKVCVFPLPSASNHEVILETPCFASHRQERKIS
jgi:hypothetical protein